MIRRAAIPGALLVAELVLLGGGVFTPRGEAADWLAAYATDRGQLIEHYGKPDYVVQHHDHWSESPLNGFQTPERPIENEVIVYCHRKELVCLYTDQDDTVIAIYFAPRRGHTCSLEAPDAEEGGAG